MRDLSFVRHHLSIAAAWCLTKEMDFIDTIHNALRDRGMREERIEEKLVSCMRTLEQLPQARASFGFWVPGRIELLGKHTDYGGGRSIVAAAEQGFCIFAQPRTDDLFNIIDARVSETVSCRIDSSLPPAGGWASYVTTTVRRLAKNFAPLRGADVSFYSDLPPAAGLSSSSALTVAVYLVLERCNQLNERPEYQREIRSSEDLAGYLGCVENGQSFGSLAGDKGVGTFGGSQDHTAILCCKAGRLSRYSYAPVRAEGTAALPDGVTFVIASSGVEAAKTGEAMESFNRASRLVSELRAIWNEKTGRNDPTLAAALASSADAATGMREWMGKGQRQELIDRFEHFCAEVCQIVPIAWRALKEKDWIALRNITDRSQDLAERLLGNQVPETVFLQASARGMGVFAASAFGAGFGGSVWAMVTESTASAFMNRWREEYLKQYPYHAARAVFFETAPGPGAFEMTE
jgi:galactokinase